MKQWKAQKLVVSMIIFVFMSCGQESSDYRLSKFSRQVDDPIIVFTAMNEGMEKVLLLHVKTDNEGYSSDSTGTAIINSVPGEYKFDCLSMGYFPVETKKITVAKSDSIRILLYLKLDTTQLPNVEVPK